MTPGVGFWRCEQCRSAYFPEPLLCARCGGASFASERVFEAVLEEFSVIRHMLGQENWQPRRIASVRTGEGLLMTVGVLDESAPGTVLALFEENSAPLGRAK
jgi:uncharacterized OB-fold protein